MALVDVSPSVGQAQGPGPRAEPRHGCFPTGHQGTHVVFPGQSELPTLCPSPAPPSDLHPMCGVGFPAFLFLREGISPSAFSLPEWLLGWEETSRLGPQPQGAG